jgi:hypothetical protein
MDDSAPYRKGRSHGGISRVAGRVLAIVPQLDQ